MSDEQSHVMRPDSNKSSVGQPRNSESRAVSDDVKGGGLDARELSYIIREEINVALKNNEYEIGKRFDREVEKEGRARLAKFGFQKIKSKRFSTQKSTDVSIQKNTHAKTHLNSPFTRESIETILMSRLCTTTIYLMRMTRIRHTSSSCAIWTNNTQRYCSNTPADCVARLDLNPAHNSYPTRIQDKPYRLENATLRVQTAPSGLNMVV